MNRTLKTTMVAAAALAALAVAGAAHARDLSKEFQTGAPSEFGRSIQEIRQDFRTGFNPTASRSVQDILSGTNLEAPAKPDSFRGVDLESN